MENPVKHFAKEYPVFLFVRRPGGGFVVAAIARMMQPEQHAEGEAFEIDSLYSNIMFMAAGAATSTRTVPADEIVAGKLRR